MSTDRQPCLNCGDFGYGNQSGFCSDHCVQAYAAKTNQSTENRLTKLEERIAAIEHSTIRYGPPVHINRGDDQLDDDAMNVIGEVVRQVADKMRLRQRGNE